MKDLTIKYLNLHSDFVDTQWAKIHLQDVHQLSSFQDSIKTSTGDVFKMFKRQFFCKSKQCLTKALFRHHKCLQNTAKTTYGDVSNMSKRQLFCKSNQCLSKPLFRQLIPTSANFLGRTFKTNQYRIFQLIQHPLTDLDTLTLDLSSTCTCFQSFIKFDKTITIGLFTFGFEKNDNLNKRFFFANNQTYTYRCVYIQN